MGRNLRRFKRKIRYLEQHGSAEEIRITVDVECLRWMIAAFQIGTGTNKTPRAKTRRRGDIAKLAISL